MAAILDGKYTVWIVGRQRGAQAVCSWLSTYVCQLADISPEASAPVVLFLFFLFIYFLFIYLFLIIFLLLLISFLHLSVISFFFLQLSVLALLVLFSVL